MKFYIKKLGCPKNDVDADYIAGKLIERGHQICKTDRDADIVIVNTCGFILPAKEESIAEILQYEQAKKKNDRLRLFVTGCLSQRYADELKNDIKLVDGFFGLGKIDELINSIENGTAKTGIIHRNSARELNYLASDKRYIDKSYPFDYLKIADGCDRFCAYCTIPLIRGNYRSRPQEEIIYEAKLLAAHGKKELILVSQEGTGYGRDLPESDNIVSLLKKLEQIDKIEWIRLMYLHPEAVTDELIDLMTNSGKVLGYFDIPLQHISDKILKSMNRPIRRAEIEKLLDTIRNASDKNCLRTTFISGFPGEEDKDFEELHDFIDEVKFDRLGMFLYSPEENTAAVRFGSQVPEKVAAERMDLLMSLQQTIAFEKNIALIDSVQQIIIDGTDADGRLIGRSKDDCPEIDQVVIVTNSAAQMGDFINVRIKMAEGYDLIGEPVV